MGNRNDKCNASLKLNTSENVKFTELKCKLFISESESSESASSETFCV